MTRSAAAPCYFGASGAEMFGVYHPPQAAADRDVGVVVCPPMGREYLKTHRALRQLALHAARSGFHALRFDYRGCGDSAGEPASFGLREWAQDVASAADELKDRSGVGRVAFVGLRLGATLAVLAAGGRRDVEGLVLWEPVLDGPGYLGEIVDRDRAFWRSLEVAVEPPDESGTVGIIGFPVSRSLHDALHGLTLTPARRPARRALLIRGDELRGEAAFLERLRGLGVVVESAVTPVDPIWADGGEMNRALIPAATFQRAVSWLEANVA
jgi:pimeloyl-ACP methyl ester carboxylesterase